MAIDMCGGASRFAVLKIEDDEEENQLKWTVAGTKKGQQGQAKGNNKQKKKKQNTQVHQKPLEQEQRPVGLQPVPSSALAPLADSAEHNRKSSQKNSPHSKKGNGDLKAQDAETYLSDLQSAIVQSRLDYKSEQKLNKLRKAQETSQAESVKGESNPDDAAASSGKKSKKQKKKEKQQQQSLGAGGEKKVVMSLEEFQQSGGAGDSNSNSPTADDPANIDWGDEEEEEPDPFNVADEASKILDKERRQEALKRSLHEESTLRNQYKHEVEKRNGKIKQLQQELKKVSGENEEIKKRNKLLCKIMMEGEMKEKAQVLKQVEDLIQVRDELTAQVTELHGDLEKERSESRKLRDEIKRLQKKG